MLAAWWVVPKNFSFFGVEISVVCCLFGFLAGIVVGVCSQFGLGGFGGCRWTV